MNLTSLSRPIHLIMPSFIIGGGRGCAYRLKNNFSQAIADYTSAVEINPNYGWAYGWMGIIYDEQRKFPEAIFNFTKAIETKSNEAQFYTNP